MQGAERDFLQPSKVIAEKITEKRLEQNRLNWCMRNMHQFRDAQRGYLFDVSPIIQQSVRLVAIYASDFYFTCLTTINKR